MSKLYFLNKESRRKAYAILADHNFYFSYGPNCSLENVDNPDYMYEILAFTGFDISEILIEKDKLTPKLYRLWSGNSNDRSEFYRVKAHDMDQVIDWIKLESNNEILNHETFNNDQLIHEIDYQDSDLVYIMLNNCLECDNYNVKKMKPRRPKQCEYCESCSAYIEINEIENPQPEDFSFKVIYPYGQDNYIDLTLKGDTK